MTGSARSVIRRPIITRMTPLPALRVTILISLEQTALPATIILMDSAMVSEEEVQTVKNATDMIRDMGVSREGQEHMQLIQPIQRMTAMT